MKLSRTVTYAVQAAIQLAQSESREPVPCSKLATEGQMPERFLLQILRNLVTHGILHSTRGVDGGYSLERPCSEISLLEVIEAVEGPVVTPAPEASANDVCCRLHEVLSEVTTTTCRELSSIKLSQLLPATVNGSGN